jgi:ABC-type iron transport system FetAB ATPase subunit
MKNNKIWIALTLIIVFSAGVLGGVLLDKHVLKTKHRRPPSRRDSARFPTLDTMAKELNLTKEQQDQIKTIFKENEKRIKEQRDSIHKQYRSMRISLLDEIKDVLDNEQKEKFDAMIKKYIDQQKKEWENRKRKPSSRRNGTREKR